MIFLSSHCLMPKKFQGFEWLFYHQTTSNSYNICMIELKNGN